MGHIVAMGQYVIGILLAILVLKPLFGMSSLSGALIEIAFVGGHGTAAGMADTFRQLGFPEGADLSLGLATVCILVGVIGGIIIINIGFRKGYSKNEEGKPVFTEQEREQIADTHGYEVKQKVKEPTAIEPLAFHFALIAVAILIGYAIQQSLILLEALTWGAWADVYFFAYIPLFPMAMIGGIVVEYLSEKFGREEYIDPNLISKISGFALDVLLVSALGTLSLDVIGSNIIPFLFISIAGTVWNVWAFLYL